VDDQRIAAAPIDVDFNLAVVDMINVKIDVLGLARV
jgi:hypothetical protein